MDHDDAWTNEEEEEEEIDTSSHSEEENELLDDPPSSTEASSSSSTVIASATTAFALPVPQALLDLLYAAWIDDSHQRLDARSRQQGLATLSCHVMEECSSASIRLININLGPRCASALTSYLLMQTQWSHSLTHLALDHNPIESFGCAEIMKCVLHLPALHHLSMQNCHIGPSGLSELAATLVSPACHLTHLKLGSCPFSSNGWLTSKPTRDASPYIVFANHGDVPSLVSFALSLSVNTKLKLLNLEGLSFSFDDEKVIDALSHALQRNTTLTSLNLSRCGLNSRDVNLILSALSQHPCLQRLDLQENDFDVTLSQALQQFMARQRHLHHLNLSHNVIATATIAAISSTLCSKLTVTPKLSTSLHTLHVSHCNLDDQACEELSRFLGDEHSPLRHLNASHNRFTFAGLNHLIPAATRLVALNVACNPVELDIDATSMITWCQTLFSLCRNVCLQQLNLSDCGLSDQSVMALCKAIMNRPPTCALTRLSLSKNFLSADLGMYLITCVQQSHWMTELNVQNTQVSFEDQKRISKICSKHEVAQRDAEPRRLQRCIQELQADQAKLKGKMLELAHEQKRHDRVRAHIVEVQLQAANMRLKEEHKRALLSESIEREELRCQDVRARTLAKRETMCEDEQTYEQRVQELEATLQVEREQVASIGREIEQVKQKIELVTKVRPALAQAHKQRIEQLVAMKEHDITQTAHMKHELCRLKDQIEKGEHVHHLLAYAHYARRQLASQGLAQARARAIAEQAAVARAAAEEAVEEATATLDDAGSTVPRAIDVRAPAALQTSD